MSDGLSQYQLDNVQFDDAKGSKLQPKPNISPTKEEMQVNQQHDPLGLSDNPLNTISGLSDPARGKDTPPAGFRKDQLPSNLSLATQKKLNNMTAKDREAWYRTYLNTHGVTVTELGKELKVLPEEYFDSYAELYRKADQINAEKPEMPSYDSSMALQEFDNRLSALAELMKAYKELLTADIHSMNAAGKAFVDLDNQLGKK